MKMARSGIPLPGHSSDELIDQLQLTPKSPKPATSTRMYVPQNIATLFMAHLLACRLIRLPYYNLHLPGLYESPHNENLPNELPPLVRL